MTKAKKATAGVRHMAAWCGCSVDKILSDSVWMNEAQAIDRAIAAAVRKAVKAERERCVKAADDVRRLGHHNLPGLHTANEIAVANGACEDIIDAIREANP
jgi:hypothetical protein